jgi:hypothetical protein
MYMYMHAWQVQSNPIMVSWHGGDAVWLLYLHLRQPNAFMCCCCEYVDWCAGLKQTSFVCHGNES